MSATFDIDRFMAGSGQVDLRDIPWDDVPKYPLTPAALRTLRYFLNTESATFYYLRALMGTKAAMVEPDMAPFLSAWNYEEEFHGRAFRRFVEAYGERVDEGYRGDMYLRRTNVERITDGVALGLSVVLPDAWPSIHMLWGAIAEHTTYNAYRQLITRTQHPVLAEICSRIMKQEAKHFAFYFQQARARLAESAMGRKLAQVLLPRIWTPVGDGMSPTEEAHHALRYLFDGAEGEVIPAIERKIGTLPGLEGFDIFTRYVERAGLKRAPAEWLAVPPGSTPAGGTTEVAPSDPTG